MSPAAELPGAGPVDDEPVVDPAAADAVVLSVDEAARAAADAGRVCAQAATDVETVGEDLAERWLGRTGQAVTQRVVDLHGDLHTSSGLLLYICDVLRTEGSALCRSLAAGGDEGEIRDADALLGTRLREACPDGAGGAGAQGQTDAALRPPDDPRLVPGWWHALTPRQRSDLAAWHPELGGVDGLPAVVRDSINRERLARMTDEGADVPGAHELAAHLDGDPHRMLLDLRPDGRAVVSDGDPDVAEHVVTFVPGTGSSTEAVQDTATRAASVCGSVEAATGAGPDSCAGVSWMDYAAPQSLPRAGLDAGPAQDGAPLLGGFQEGLDAQADALGRTDTRHDVLGYSYGSVVVGTASARPEGLAADRQLHVGSPGTSVDSLDQLNVDHDGRVAPARPEEVVGARSRFDAVPWWAMTGIHGGAPGDEGFGGGEALDLTGDWPSGDAHSRYFDPGSESLATIGRALGAP